MGRKRWQSGLILQPGITEDVVYRRATLRGAPVELACDLFQPIGSRAPTPVLVWFHSGAFCTGTTKRPGHRALGRWAMREGLTLVVPQYRLAADERDLTPEVQAMVDVLRAKCMEGFRAEMAGPWALAALEDSVALLHWLLEHKASLGLDGQIVVGGTSAGGVNALNIVQTAPYLGMHVPDIRGAICYSGGFAYPDIYRTGRVPVFAAHDPDDRSVDIGSIREIAKRDALVELLESPGQGHGGFRLKEDETNREMYLRILDFVSRVCIRSKFSRESI